MSSTIIIISYERQSNIIVKKNFKVATAEGCRNWVTQKLIIWQVCHQFGNERANSSVFSLRRKMSNDSEDWTILSPKHDMNKVSLQAPAFQYYATVLKGVCMERKVGGMHPMAIQPSPENILPEATLAIYNFICLSCTSSSRKTNA